MNDGREPTLEERRADLSALKEAVGRRQGLRKFTEEWQRAMDAEAVLVERVRRWIGHRDPQLPVRPTRAGDRIVSDWIGVQQDLQRVPVGSPQAMRLRAEIERLHDEYQAHPLDPDESPPTRSAGRRPSPTVGNGARVLGDGG